MELTKQPTALQKVIRDRRSVKKHYNHKPVTEETVKELLADAVWAPTHGVRQPWRFIFVGPFQTESFAQQVAATYPEERQQNRLEYLREPTAFLIVVMDEPKSTKQWDENFGATASMIQNFWLLAWEQQLGVVWKTNSHIYDSQVKEILNVGENEKIVGFLHLGYFDEKPAKKDRIPAAEKFTTFKG
ncbi:nitroreductase [Lentibacillus sp. CBA3610]|uniref:nitroreductase family protein n=1 Tax=Lentibacillus sp. CBA3610 TaxID=2518176 RepID=UPI0015955F7F|nr:nitroreductase [Lentibacillus sp. CBA3610]QKY71121.1 nitroreductase [Lentibacillus sp. CBA3610]